MSYRNDPGVPPPDDDVTGGLIDGDVIAGIDDAEVDDAELEDLMDRLRGIGGAVDPVPSIVTELAHAALETRDLDAELASLTADSAIDSAALVRSVGLATPRMMSFEAESVTVELQVDRRDDVVQIRGFVLGAVRLAVESRAGVRDVSLDDQGWFLAEGVPAGAVRFRIERADGGHVTTEWMAV